MPAAPGVAAAAAAKARDTAAIAASWPSVSEPDAPVSASSNARRPSGELHTPSSVRGEGPVSVSRMAGISPVGSRVKRDLKSSPSGEASRSRVLPIAACSPSTLKRCGVTESLSR